MNVGGVCRTARATPGLLNKSMTVSDVQPHENSKGRGQDSCLVRSGDWRGYPSIRRVYELSEVTWGQRWFVTCYITQVIPEMRTFYKSCIQALFVSCYLKHPGCPGDDSCLVRSGDWRGYMNDTVCTELFTFLQRWAGQLTSALSNGLSQ